MAPPTKITCSISFYRQKTMWEICKKMQQRRRACAQIKTQAGEAALRGGGPHHGHFCSAEGISDWLGHPFEEIRTQIFKVSSGHFGFEVYVVHQTFHLGGEDVRWGWESTARGHHRRRASSHGLT